MPDSVVEVEEDGIVEPVGILPAGTGILAGTVLVAGKTAGAVVGIAVAAGIAGSFVG